MPRAGVCGAAAQVQCAVIRVACCAVWHAGHTPVDVAVFSYRLDSTPGPSSKQAASQALTALVHPTLHTLASLAPQAIPLEMLRNWGCE